MPAPQDCQEQACAIQTCLTRNNYNESACHPYVVALYKCCSAMYDSADKEGRKVAESTACPIKSVVERKMKAFEREEGK